MIPVLSSNILLLLEVREPEFHGNVCSREEDFSVRTATYERVPYGAARDSVRGGASGYEYGDERLRLRKQCAPQWNMLGRQASGAPYQGATPETLREEGPAGAQGLRAEGSKRPRAVVSPGDSVPRWLRITRTGYNAPQGAIRYRLYAIKG